MSLDVHALRAFAERFDRGAYWDAHEVLEATWRGNRDPVLQGLIQVAAVFVHIERRNWTSARGVLERALRHLQTASPYAAPNGPVPVEALDARLTRVGEHLRALQEGRASDFDPDLCPKMSSWCP